MTKEEFIAWCPLEKHGNESWRALIDYEECVYDYLYIIGDDKVSFTYEELYWGGRNDITKEYTFDEFKEAYENCTLKDD